MRTDIISELNFSKEEYLDLLRIYSHELKILISAFEYDNSIDQQQVHKLKANASTLGYPELFVLLKKLQFKLIISANELNKLVNYSSIIEHHIELKSCPTVK